MKRSILSSCCCNLKWNGYHSPPLPPSPLPSPNHNPNPNPDPTLNRTTPFHPRARPTDNHRERFFPNTQKVIHCFDMFVLQPTSVNNHDLQMDDNYFKRNTLVSRMKRTIPSSCCCNLKWNGYHSPPLPPRPSPSPSPFPSPSPALPFTAPLHSIHPPARPIIIERAILSNTQR